MRDQSTDPFLLFLEARKKDLRRISRHTRGESSLEDVESEAWLMSQEFGSKGGGLDLTQPEHQPKLIAHLYQKLVRYTELNVRNAVRLDHAPGGDESQVHPLAHLLSADPGYDPVNLLMREEEERARSLEAEPDAHQSLAGAYLHLLRRFENRMRDVADYLMISLSYRYQRCAHARRLAIHQQSLPRTAASGDGTFVPVSNQGSERKQTASSFGARSAPNPRHPGLQPVRQVRPWH